MHVNWSVTAVQMYYCQIFSIVAGGSFVWEKHSPPPLFKTQPVHKLPWSQLGFFSRRRDERSNTGIICWFQQTNESEPLLGSLLVGMFDCRVALFGLYFWLPSPSSLFVSTNYFRNNSWITFDSIVLDIPVATPWWNFRVRWLFIKNTSIMILWKNKNWHILVHVRL